MFLRKNDIISPPRRVADLTAFVMCRETDSSPLVRGRLFTSLFLAVQFRFIPSYEGQTRFRLQRCGSSTIHPLLRGADGASLAHWTGRRDSSPLTRGRQTMQSLLPAFQMSIHPLIRRADIVLVVLYTTCFDSSPLTRGRLIILFLLYVIRRFIPSYEGQTLASYIYCFHSFDSSHHARGQTLSVYAAFSRLKHLVVQFAQMPLSSRPHI